MPYFRADVNAFGAGVAELGRVRPVIDAVLASVATARVTAMPEVAR